MFKIGEIVTNQDIIDEFRVGNSGGMRRSLTKNSLILIADQTKGIYKDEWHDQILHYTGMGKSGDQKLSYSQNKTLNESQSNGVILHLFEVLVRAEYIYLGEVALEGKPRYELQTINSKHSRHVWIFPLKPLSESKWLEQYISIRNKR